MKKFLSAVLLTWASVSFALGAFVSGTRVSDTIVPLDDTDEYPTHDAKYGKEHWILVANAAERTSLTEPGGISEMRRTLGMVAFQLDTSHVWKLSTLPNTWTDLGEFNATAATVNLYTQDGTLLGDRTIAGDNKSLTLSGLGNWSITGNGTSTIQAVNMYVNGTSSVNINQSGNHFLFPFIAASLASDDTLLVQNPSTKTVKRTTATLAQALAQTNLFNTTGTLTGNRSLLGGGYDFTIQNVDDLTLLGAQAIIGASGLVALTSTTGSMSVSAATNLNMSAQDILLNSANNKYLFKKTPTTAAGTDEILGIDVATGEVRHAASATIANIAAASTFYNSSGSLSGNRTVTGAGYNLSFSGVGNAVRSSTTVSEAATTIASYSATDLTLVGVNSISFNTPNVEVSAAEIGQYLRLQNTSGSVEFATAFYTGSAIQTGSAYAVANTDLVPDYDSATQHPAGTVAFIKFDANSVGGDTLAVGPSVGGIKIQRHDGTEIAADDIVANKYYLLVRNGTDSGSVWILQGSTASTLAASLPLNNAKVVDTVADLVDFDPTSGNEVFTRGYWTAGDGGAGRYYWENNQTSTNTGSKIASSIDGSWSLIADEFNVKQWGAKGDGSTDDATAINAAITFAGTQAINRTVYIPRGEFRIGAPIYIRGSNLKLRVNGHVKNINGTNSAVLVAGAVYATGTAVRITNGIAYYDSSNVTIDGEGIGILDQNGPNATAWASTNTAAGAWHTLTAQTVQGLKIKDITVTNSIIWGIAVELCKDAAVTGTRVYNGRHSGRQVDGVYVKGTQDGIHMHDCMDSVVAGNYVESQDDTLAVIAYRSHSKNIVVANNVGRVLTRYYMADGVTPDTNTLAGRFFLSAGIFGQTADVSLTNVVFSANVCTGGQGMFYVFDEDGDVAHTGTTQGIKLIGNSFSGLVDELLGTNVTREAWLILGAKDVDIVNNSFINIARVGRAVDYLSPTPGFIRFAGNHFENWQIAPDSQSLFVNQPESILWFSNGTDIVIENNTFVNNQINPIYIGNNGGESTTNQFNSVTIRGNIFKNNMQRWSATPTTLSSVATVYGANNVVFSDNVLDGNKGRGATVRSYKTLQANNNKVTAHSSGYTDYGEAFYFAAALNDSAITTMLQGNSVDTIDGYAMYFRNPGFTTVQNNIIRNSNVGYGSDQAMFMYLSGSALSDLPYANFGGVISGNQIFDATAKIPMYVGGAISTAAYTGRRLSYLDTQGAGTEVAVAPNGAGIIEFSQGFVSIPGATYTLKTYQQFAVTDVTCTVTLPDATLCRGKIFAIKNADTAATLTLDGNGSQTIDGATTLATSTVNEVIKIISDGANWLVL